MIPAEDTPPSLLRGEEPCTLMLGGVRGDLHPSILNISDWIYSRKDQQEVKQSVLLSLNHFL